MATLALIGIVSIIVLLLMLFGYCCQQSQSTRDERTRSTCQGWGGALLLLIVVLLIAAIVMGATVPDTAPVASAKAAEVVPAMFNLGDDASTGLTGGGIPVIESPADIFSSYSQIPLALR